MFPIHRLRVFRNWRILWRSSTPCQKWPWVSFPNSFQCWKFIACGKHMSLPMQRHINLAQHLSTFTSKPSFLGRLDMEQTLVEAQSYDMYVIYGLSSFYLQLKLKKCFVWSQMLRLYWRNDSQAGAFFGCLASPNIIFNYKLGVAKKEFWLFEASAMYTVFNLVLNWKKYRDLETQLKFYLLVQERVSSQLWFRTYSYTE